MYPRRGRLPATREGKLVYELSNDAVVGLSKAVYAMARAEMLARGSDHPGVVEIAKALAPINDALESVNLLIGADTEIESRLLAVMGWKEVPHDGH